MPVANVVAGMVLKRREGDGAELSVAHWLKTIVAGDAVAKKAVFQLWPDSNIMHDQRHISSGIHSICNNADVREIAGQHPRDNIARFIISSLF